MYVLRSFFLFFCVCVCVVVFFLLQNTPIAMIYDDAIYLLIYFFEFYFNVLRPSPILKTIQKMCERNQNKFTTANK